MRPPTLPARPGHEKLETGRLARAQDGLGRVVPADAGDRAAAAGARRRTAAPVRGRSGRPTPARACPVAPGSTPTASPGRRGRRDRRASPARTRGPAGSSRRCTAGPRRPWRGTTRAARPAGRRARRSRGRPPCPSSAGSSTRRARPGCAGRRTRGRAGSTRPSRIDRSVRVGHTNEPGIVPGTRPTEASAYAASMVEYSWPTCRVPANATAGSMPVLSLGSRSRRKLTCSCAPSGFISRSSGSPIRMCSTHGATFASTKRDWTVCGPDASCHVTSARSSPARIALTPALVRISAPARVGGRGEAVGQRAHAADRHRAGHPSRCPSSSRGTRGSGAGRRRSSRRTCRGARRRRRPRGRCRRRTGAR